jgi:hypothetical protein
MSSARSISSVVTVSGGAMRQTDPFGAAENRIAEAR